jgi:hypothetical protein
MSNPNGTPGVPAAALAANNLYSLFPQNVTGGNPVTLAHQLLDQTNMIYASVGPDVLLGSVSQAVVYAAPGEQTILTCSPTGGGVMDGATNMGYLSNTNPGIGGIVPSVPASPFRGFWGIVWATASVNSSAAADVTIRLALESTAKTSTQSIPAGKTATLTMITLEFGTVAQTNTALTMIIGVSAATTLTIKNPQQMYVWFGTCGLGTVSP